jgi:hypothetical protein
VNCETAAIRDKVYRTYLDFPETAESKRRWNIFICRDRPRLKRRIGLYGRQHSKETFPSRVISDIATDVAAVIQ